MSDKELIKQEIERIRVKEDNSITPDQAKHHTHYHVGRRELCDTLLQFIDSLPEEPVNKDLEEEIKKYFNGWWFHMGVITPDDYFADLDDMNNIAHHFAEWQRKKDVGEMMKTLVEGEIVKDIHNQLKVTSEPLNDTFGRFGDKVKIIIVKED